MASRMDVQAAIVAVSPAVIDPDLLESALETRGASPSPIGLRLEPTPSCAEMEVVAGDRTKHPPNNGVIEALKVGNRNTPSRVVVRAVIPSRDLLYQNSVGASRVFEEIPESDMGSELGVAEDGSTKVASTDILVKVGPLRIDSSGVGLKATQVFDHMPERDLLSDSGTPKVPAAIVAVVEDEEKDEEAMLVVIKWLDNMKDDFLVNLKKVVVEKRYPGLEELDPAEVWREYVLKRKRSNFPKLIWEIWDPDSWIRGMETDFLDRFDRTYADYNRSEELDLALVWREKMEGLLIEELPHYVVGTRRFVRSGLTRRGCIHREPEGLQSDTNVGSAAVTEEVSLPARAQLQGNGDVELADPKSM